MPRIDACRAISVTSGMEDTATLTLAGLCIGIALTGLCSTFAQLADRTERLSLCMVFGAFGIIVALPVSWAFGKALYVFYLPFAFVMLLTLPAAIYYYVGSKTGQGSAPRILWRDLAMPVVGFLVCLGYWVLPLETKTTMFILGELPMGNAPATLALITFALILCWFVASFVYLLAIVRRLTRYRTHIRTLYSNLENRDLRWIDWVMAMFVFIWAAGALLLADENFGSGSFYFGEVLFGLTACCLLSLSVFAFKTWPVVDTEEQAPEPEPKYARSALTTDHAAKLAKRIEKAMQQDALYVDPNLSLQKLSQHIGAVPNHVSQTLNQEIGTTFFDYVGQWRIKAAKPLILAGDGSVLAVALEVGFNSKSTFYKAFKKETGVTPKAYRLNGSARN